MKPEELCKKLPGAIAFPVTPFKSDLSLDIPGLRKNIRRLLKHPISAMVAAGGTGEMYSLSPGEHGEVVKAIVEETAGRVPVRPPLPNLRAEEIAEVRAMVERWKPVLTP
ncbi:MAG: dihydrodipicolinate synthase family protein [Candidatus Acidiferrales bacterium]